MDVKNFKNHLDIPREHLPQLDADTDEIVAYLNDAGVHNVRRKVSCDRLKPTQSQLNMTKVDQMIASGPPDDRTIFVSRDGFIIDGHHYWAAKIKSDHPEIDVVVVDGCIIDLLNWFNNLDFTQSKKITEKRSQF